MYVNKTYAVYAGTVLFIFIFIIVAIIISRTFQVGTRIPCLQGIFWERENIRFKIILSVRSGYSYKIRD